MKSRTTIATAALAGTFAAPAAAHAHALLQPTIAGQTVNVQLQRAGHLVLARRDARLADAVRRMGGEAPSRAAMHRLTNRALDRLHVRLEREKHQLRRRARTATATAVSGTLQSIAACESGGDPHAIGGGGAFRGKYQFTYATWAAMGGSGDPAAAPEAEQDRLAAKLYASAGAGQWPVCGH